MKGLRVSFEKHLFFFPLLLCLLCLLFFFNSSVKLIGTGKADIAVVGMGKADSFFSSSAAAATCSVCLQSLQPFGALVSKPSEEPGRLSCGCEFHVMCAVRMLLQVKPACPVCARRCLTILRAHGRDPIVLVSFFNFFLLVITSIIS